MAKKKITRKTVPKKTGGNNAIIAAVGIVFLVVVAVGISAFLFTAAPGQQTLPRDEYDNYYQPPAGTPIMTMIRPLSGEVIRSSTIGIRVNVTNFQLVDIAANRQNVENQGHLTYLLDGAEIKKTVYKADSIANVAKGTHTVSVELRNNDNTPLNPPVAVSVTVTVE